MFMKMYSQRDPRWSFEKLGESARTVGSDGCLDTSLMMLENWYNPNAQHTPGWGARNLGYTREGLFLWKSMDGKTSMRFVWRYYRRDDEKILQILRSRDNACVLQVNNGKHWVALIGYSRISGYKIADPIDGKVVWLKDRYPNITGFAEVTRA